jgi:hypothetical protein
LYLKPKLGMISNQQFWRTWPVAQKTLAFLLFASFIILSLSLIFWYFQDLENFLKWDLATELNNKFVAKEAFYENGLRFAENEKVFYLKEWFIPSAPLLNTFPGYLFLGVIFIGSVFLLAGLSYQNGFWFLFAIVTLAVLLLSLQLEIPFQTVSNTPFLIAFSIFGGILFFFNSFYKKASFILRLCVLAAGFTALVLFSEISENLHFPAYAMAQHGLVFGIIIFAIFTFLISHESIALIVKTASASGGKGTSTLTSFLVLSTFYLLNCLLIYLENIRAIDYSAFVISPLWLFLLSSTLGFWGFRDQSETLEWFSYRQTGFWFYSGLGLISLSLLGYAYASGNDSLYELLNDYIAICHLALGLVFFVHVLINFISLFRQGLRVDKVLYKPKFSRLFLAKTAAVAIVGFLLIQKNIYSFNQFKAAITAATGDFYLKEGEKAAAESFYKESAQYDTFNNKANYALGMMAQQVGDGATAAYYFKRANQKNPTKFSYAALSRHFENEGLFFDALFNLREGLNVFPKSPELLTNMAAMLEKAGARDSVYFYLNQAMENCNSCETEKTNMLAFWIENALPEKLDSVANPYLGNKSISQTANSFAIKRMTGNETIVKAEPKFSQLNTSDFALLYNKQLTETAKPVTDSIWTQLTEEMISSGLSNDILFLKTHQYYTQNEKIKAIKQLTYLAQDSTENGLMYRRTLGMWYLKEGLFDHTVRWFLASGDTESVELLNERDFKLHLMAKQKQQAEEILQQEVTSENYKTLYNSAPLNPYLIIAISEFLEKSRKDNEAYNLVFDALEFNEKSADLWEKQVFLALKNGVKEYAETGSQNLKRLLTPEAYTSFHSRYEEAKLRLEKERELF